jgi:hypothetical protein
MSKGDVLHCDNNTSAATIETVPKLKFDVFPHPTYVQLPLEDVFLGLLLADSEEVEDAVHTWLRTGLKKNCLHMASSSSWTKVRLCDDEIYDIFNCNWVATRWQLYVEKLWDHFEKWQSLCW